MKIGRLSMFIFLVLAPLVVGAALPAELYWKSMLPITAMPKAVKELLRAENMEKVISVDQKVPLVLQQHDGPNPFFYNWARPVTSATDQLHNDPNVFFYSWGRPATSATDQLHNDPNVFFYSWGRQTTTATDQLHNDPNVFFYTWGRPTTSATDQLHNDPNIFFYDWAHPTTSAVGQQQHATLAIDQQRDDSLKVLFLFEHDLYPGKKLEMFFTKNPYSTALIPREVANTIPFSLEMVPEILKIFSIAPESKEAKLIKKTIFYCQTPSVIKTEQKQCSTSLESMVDYITSKFGKNVEAYSTEVEKETKLQNYTIAPGVKEISDKLMACHQIHYPHVVFFCHQLSASRAYFVPLEGSDGTRVKAIAVCHSDTSSWDPNHFAFRALKIKPGTVPVCHFSTADTIIWTPKKTM